MEPATLREYDIVLFGATGYTGKLCAEYITRKLPTNLKWAIAGRSGSKLSAVVDKLKSYNPDRLQPGIEVATSTLNDVDMLAKKTRVLINTVGPYHMYGSPVVEACATNGTHYLDVTGETAWVREMIRKYHKIAKTNNAIIIPEIGVESAPSDLLTWSLVAMIRDRLSLGVKEVTSTLYEMKSQPSGGTLATVLGMFEHYSRKELVDSMKPWALSPISGPKSKKPMSLYRKVFGVYTDPDFGVLIPSPICNANKAIVQRSWGLLDNGEFYGLGFTFEEYQRVRNQAVGIMTYFAFIFGMLALTVSPFRWLVRKFVYAPGQGPLKESHEKESLEYRVRAIADQSALRPQRGLARFRYEGGMYYLTGVLLAEAAMVILGDDVLPKKLGGGVLTPAMLGQPFIDRLRSAGVIFETAILSNE